MHLSEALTKEGDSRIALSVMLDAIDILKNRNIIPPYPGPNAPKKAKARHMEKQREYVETFFWFTDPNDTGPYSFEHICHRFNIEPDRARREIIFGSPLHSK